MYNHVFSQWLQKVVSLWNFLVHIVARFVGVVVDHTAISTSTLSVSDVDFSGGHPWHLNGVVDVCASVWYSCVVAYVLLVNFSTHTCRVKRVGMAYTVLFLPLLATSAPPFNCEVNIENATILL